MIVYVYEDTDNNVVEVFETLKAAKDFAIKQWPEIEEEWWEGWETSKDSWHTCEYVTIYKRQIRKKP